MKTATEKAAVMIAFDRGEKIQWSSLKKPEWMPSTNPSWNWYDSDYRIAPKPVEGWVWIHANGMQGCSHESKTDAYRAYSGVKGRVVFMREVIE